MKSADNPITHLGENERLGETQSRCLGKRPWILENTVRLNRPPPLHPLSHLAANEKAPGGA